MATIAENLLELQQTKENFKTAFAEKEVDLTGVPFTEYPNKFSEIKTTEDLNTELTEQETKLAKLEEDVNALSDKPQDMLQQLVNGSKSCNSLCSSYPLDNLDFINGLDTSEVTNMVSMFKNCSKLTSLDLSNFNTSNVTTMGSMFSGCSSLTSVDLSSFDTSNVSSFAGMFENCMNLEDIDVSGLDTSNATSMGGMFLGCKKLKSIDISNFNLSNATTINTMFQNCNKLESVKLPIFKGGKITKMFSFFANCYPLKIVDFSNFNTSEITDMSLLFAQCTGIETIINLDLRSNGSNTTNMFNDCRNLTNLSIKNIRYSLQIGGWYSGNVYGSLLTNESLINTFKELWDLTGSTSRTLTLSTTSKENIANIYVKLIDVTDDMRAEDEYIDNKKPCVVCESTDEGAMTLTEYAISKNWAIA